MTDGPVTVEQQYTSAAHSSNLRVQADRRGDADVMIAAGWSQSRIGMALLRLHSEYDGTPRPRKMTQSQIEVYARALRGPLLGPNAQRMTHEQSMKRAQDHAAQWHHHGLCLMLGRMKSLPSVREQLAIEAARFCVDDAAGVAVAVLMWWLDKTCPVCHGKKREVIENTPVLSDTVCQSCQGSGERTLPHGKAGRKVVSLINNSLFAARVSLRMRLRQR